jgi:nucleoside phosphorylase
MRVLVTFAVEAEFAPWRKLRKFRFIDYDGLQLWKTDSDRVEITALITGMGGQSAARAMDLMMRMADQNQHFDVCISSGLAGALCDTFKPGDVVAPKTLISERRHADLTSDQLVVDPELHKMALANGAMASDCLYSTDQVLVKASQKKACSSRAQSVDMESFEVVKEAYAWGARGVVVRAISDSASEDLPINFNLTMSATNQVSTAKVLLELAKNPFALPSLIRFGRQSQQAAERLASFLDQYVQKVATIVSSKSSTAAGAR